MGRKMIELNDQEIIIMYQQGYTLRDLAKLYGVSKMTILRRLENKGIKRRKQIWR